MVVVARKALVRRARPSKDRADATTTRCVCPARVARWVRRRRSPSRGVRYVYNHQNHMRWPLIDAAQSFDAQLGARVSRGAAHVGYSLVVKRADPYTPRHL